MSKKERRCWRCKAPIGFWRNLWSGICKGCALRLGMQ